MTYKNVSEAISGLEKPKQLRFSHFVKVCEQFFGDYRVNGSHYIFKTSLRDYARINLQERKDKNAKPYQVQQVLNALRKLKELEEDKQNEQND
jgi:hypothetical protein